ncbi:MAG: hypothetical protein AAF939_12705 [Planctomycetota bacterium]
MARPAFAQVYLIVCFLFCSQASVSFGQVISAPVVIRSTSISPASLPTAAPNLVTSPVQAGPDVSTGVVEAAAAAEPEESPEDKLVQLLLEAKFERTTQNMLKAWSYQDPESKSKSETEPKKYSVQVENVLGQILVLTSESETEIEADSKVTLLQGASSITAEVVSVDGTTLVVKKLTVVSPQADRESNEKPEPKASDQESKKVEELKEIEKATNAKGENLITSSGEQSKAVQPLPPPEQKPESHENEKPTKTSESMAAEDPANRTESSNGDDPQAGGDPPGKKVDSDAVSNKASAELATGDSLIMIPVVETKKANVDVDAENRKKVDSLVRSVQLGKWDNLKSFLATLKKENATKVYGHVLTALSKSVSVMPEGIPPEMAQQFAQMNRQQSPPKSFLTPEDILQLSEASPDPIQIEQKNQASDQETTSDQPTDEELISKLSLPPGVTVESLPPELIQQLKSQGEANGIPGDPAEQNTPAIKSIDALGRLIKIAKDSGHDFSKFIEIIMTKGTTHFGQQNRIKRLTTAQVLLAGGLIEDVDQFLPSLEQESTLEDLEALQIWSKVSLNRYRTKKVAQWLEKAWQANQAILKMDDLDPSDQEKALTNLIELSPQVEKQVGQQWLNASFTEAPDRGMKILTNLGTKSATMAKQATSVSETSRFKLLSLQNEAVENLIRVSPETAGKWAQAMTMLANNWISEAETSLKYSKQNSRNTFMQIDMYGNYYWVDENQWRSRYGGQRNPRPIKLGDILEICPSQTWQEFVSPSLHTQLRKLTANLYLRINEEDKAFPFIEQIAPEHPEIAKDLIEEFLKIWTRNHDPNTDKRQRNPYIYFYGFDQKAESIPLTRSKQERNLKELKSWVDRIRKMEVDVDEGLLANAFTTCHSSAEVFRLESVKNVFGELDQLKPETVAAICQKMRTNLSGQWKDIRNQEDKKTRRREPEVQQEVIRGYEVALKVIQEALEGAPENWQLHLAKACLMFDENAYSQTVQKSSEFSDRRDLAFAQFERAAEKYADVVTSLEQQEQSTSVFDFWFYASLGACDLGKITNKTTPDLRQYPKIREAILGLDGQLSEDHMAKVANNMFTRMSPIKPEIKFRYLRGGFEIVGDHPRAWEARNLYDYYKDLVSEIKLEVAIDGSENVGHGQPFGIYVNLLHTSEIERESGGFGKYVQNQNNMAYAYNYGRPTEDYRDKFNDAVNQALEKQFEILNVTFQSADAMESIPAVEKNWRLTPYAYILLKSKGPEVDRIAPLKLDLDFLDTSGYVVIPIESPAVVVDASNESGEPRPVEDLKITQTLDERRADESKLILEVSATAKGLIPELDQIVDLDRKDFEVVSVDDQGVLPASFDKESDRPQIISDRSWTVEYKAKEGIQPAVFEFSQATGEDTILKFQKYEDADLVQVDGSVVLEKEYGKFSWSFLYIVFPVLAVVIIGSMGLYYVFNEEKEVVKSRFHVPDDVNPFTVLGLLKDIKQHNGIDIEKAKELDQSINRIESFYFDKSSLTEENEEDLKELASRWVQQAR